MSGTGRNCAISPVPTRLYRGCYTRRMTRRNFWLGVLNGLFFTLAETLMDSSLVLVAFIGHLTPATFWLGLLAPLRDGGWFLPQLWTSGYLQSQTHKLWIYRWVAVVRIACLTIITLAMVLLRDPVWILSLFFGCFVIYSFCSGLAGLPFLEVVGKTIPPNQRGLFFAWRLALGGLASLGASAVVKWLLDDAGPLAFPNNFGLLLALATLWAAVGLVAFALVKEPPDAHVRPPAAFPVQLRRAWQIVQRDPAYRYFILLRASLMIAGMALPFFAVYVQRQLGGSLSFVGVYLASMSAASFLSNVFFGRYALRLGNRRILVIGMWAGLAMLGVVLALMLVAQWWPVPPLTASLWLIPAFLLAGVREAGIGVAGQPLLLDIAPPSERSIYLGFSNSFLGVVLLSTGLSGLLVDVAGFLALILLALAANLFALHAATRLRAAYPAPPADPAPTLAK